MRGARILIVEDESLVALNAELTLAAAGLCVCGTVATASAALSLAESCLPELALVDLELADGRTGPWLSQTLSRRFGVTCILTTAHLAAREREESAACALLGKPYTEEELLHAVRYCRSLRAGHQLSHPPHGLTLLA